MDGKLCLLFFVEHVFLSGELLIIIFYHPIPLIQISSLILFGPMSQSFMKIVPVDNTNCGVNKVGYTTMGVGVHKLDQYLFRKIRKSQE